MCTYVGLENPSPTSPNSVYPNKFRLSNTTSNVEQVHSGNPRSYTNCVSQRVTTFFAKVTYSSSYRRSKDQFRVRTTGVVSFPPTLPFQYGALGPPRFRITLVALESLRNSLRNHESKSNHVIFQILIWQWESARDRIRNQGKILTVAGMSDWY